jgi:ferredoxin-NADP reductase
VNRGKLPFKAGQCFTVGLPGGGVNREYTSYSGEADSWLEFLILEAENGIVSAALKSCRPGDFVEIHGAYGGFVLKSPEDHRRRLFIGTGTGIAPFHSFVRTHPDLDYNILHGVRFADEQYDREDYQSGRYVSCVSREPGGDFHGRVTDYLRLHPPVERTECYLCGNRDMISDVYDLLRDKGVASDDIFTEVFF